MKRVILFAAIAASVFMLVSASVWEGAAGIGLDLPENGRFLATNSFPVNTIVEVVNLENNKCAIFIVSSSLENSGLLALFSTDAADLIGLRDTGRIQMREKTDQVSYSDLGERRSFSGDPNYSAGLNTDNEIIVSGGFTEYLDGFDLAMMEAEPRPPVDWREPDTDSFISKTTANSVNKSDIIKQSDTDGSTSALPNYSQPFDQPGQLSASAGSITNFSNLYIQNFERGMYYVQIGAYKTTQTVASEILKVEKNLPVAIMKIGNVEEPIYRVLIGPLSLGEGGAVLQRYKTDYKDAFIRAGN
jgi:hypothetical protein